MEGIHHQLVIEHKSQSRSCHVEKTRLSHGGGHRAAKTHWHRGYIGSGVGPGDTGRTSSWVQIELVMLVYPSRLGLVLP